MEQQIRGYIDPRTGRYKWASEENAEQVKEDLGFIWAWRFFWDGPINHQTKEPYVDRQTWIESDGRRAWFESLTEEQRTMLQEAPPPEEVPSLAENG